MEKGNSQFYEPFVRFVKNHYMDFSGRSRRRDFWLYTLCQFLINLVAIILVVILSKIGLQIIGNIMELVVSLALLLPTLSANVRRLHDTGREWYFIFLSLIPLVNLYYIYLLTIDSQEGENKFGPNPKEQN